MALPHQRLPRRNDKEAQAGQFAVLDPSFFSAFAIDFRSASRYALLTKRKGGIEMKHKGGEWMAAGLLLGMALGGTGASATEQWRKAVPSWQPIFVDGERVQMEGYNIGGNNYVKLRDMGQKIGFNLYWDNGVQVESAGPTPAKPLRLP